MMNMSISKDFKYFNYLVETYINKHLGLSLAPAQREVLQTMLLYDNALFVHGRGVGATFLLAILAVVLRLIDQDINMAVASETIRQAEFLNKEVERFNNIDPLNIVTIDEAVLGGYDVLLLDEMTNISKDNAESLVTHIKNKSISKIIAVCSGYRRYFHIASLANYMYRSPHDINSVVITKGYEDMPDGFFDLDNIEAARATFEYEEDFNMEYKGYVI